MTDEIVATAGDAGEDQSLRGALQLAFDEQERESAAEASPPAEEQAPVEPAEEIAQDAQPADDQPPEDESPAEEPDALKAPERWTEDERELFDTLDDGTKAILLRRHREMEADYTRKTQQIAEQRKTLEAMEQVLAPHRQSWSQRGVSDAQVVQTLLNAEAFLRQNPAVGIQRLAQSYGVDLGQFAPPREDVDSFDTDPQQQQLQARLAQLEQQLQTQAYTSQMTQQQQIDAQIRSFADAVGQDGTPLHPHFEQVQNRMATLIRAEAESGNTLTMEEAYGMAVKLDPNLSATEQQTEAQRKAEEAERKAIQAAIKARKAQRANVQSTRPTSSPSGADYSQMSIREQLAAAAEQMQG